jgi:hypothetical protein
MSDLKDSDEITGTCDMGGFTLPPEGSIAKGTAVLMCFTGEVTVCGDEENGLLFECEYADDPSAKTKIYCNKDKQSGLSMIVGIGQQSGTFDKIDKVRIAGGKQPIQNAKGKVTVKTLTHPKFMAQMRKELVGTSAYCTITHSPAKPYEDKKTGEMKEGFAQANISKLMSVKEYKAGKGVGSATSAAKAPEGVITGGTDDDFD